jgi:glutamine synthetase adenylyltransferase
MFTVRLRRADHIRQYSIRSTRTAGWEVSLEEDRRLTRQMRYDDWHRVERALEQFRREVADLAAQGWEVQSSTHS